MRHPTFAEAAGWWLKLGFVSFGGPAGQIATMHREVVERRRWLSEARFQHALAYCTVLPGPEAQQLATYIGWLLHGLPGGIVAGALFILPSLFLLVGLSWAYVDYGNVPAVAAAFRGVQPAIVAVVLLAAWRIARRSLRGWPARALALASLLACLGGVPFPAVVLGAFVLGTTGQFGHHVGAKVARGDDEAVIGDHTPVAFAARPVLVTAVALVIGGGLAAFLVPDLREMALFFTGLALLTFGGAYAVLPYLHDGAVDRGWAFSAQVMDGLALGETTPGPLIMVVTFVGFLGGGVLGALVATLYTFLPSFVFILAGAPLVEKARQVPKLAGPLAAVSAAVVGVIVHLGIRLGEHALWPGGTLDGAALVVSLLALVALVRFDVGIVSVIGVAAAVGWGRWLVVGRA